MKRIKTQRDTRPFISAIIQAGKSEEIMSGKEIKVTVNGLRYKASWHKQKGLCVELI